ncbi:ABC transporter ATP-binding protein [Polymorphum gilvum]|uniref:ABC transporter, nucleotide binding/ATPase protein n=1 Tax=Polymorphum gilvum (strain LMG 25793 / CGMCC 1.9160 / SL003B-26A1) TaxID=991905 RepID=F2IZN9_POLGS|nr:ABC transporter ATP-binding protein [Polymorphum gilvum]ADZ69596.1 ABC transporter, nucleotide binding/ATPase protein [Polymorphum gilvum SL003B-26A1]
MESLYRLFERWIDPFGKGPGGPGSDMPSSGAAFLMHFVRQARWPFVLMLALGGITAAIEAGIYSFIGMIVDMLQADARADLFSRHGPVLLAMAGVVLVLRTAVATLTALVEEQTVVPGFTNLVRWQAHRRIMDQSLSFFHDEFAGRISAKVWQAGQSAAEFMTTLLQTVWYIVVYALATLLLVADLDLWLGAAVALWLVLFAAIARIYVPRIRTLAKGTAHAASGVTGRLVDTYTNIQTVKLFGTRGGEEQGVRIGYGVYLDVLRRFTRSLTAVRGLMALLSGTMMVLIAGLTLLFWQAGTVSVGEVALTLGLVLRLNLLLNRMLGQLNGLFRTMGTLQDSMDMIVRPIALTDAPSAPDLVVTEGRIDFEGVRFHYGRRGGVIDSLSFSIEPGEKIGVVGPSGAGKSTLANLLLRFYDVEAGRILIDGQDIGRVTQASLRRQIGMVSQDTSLLHRSIRDNILYGRPEADEAALRRAAERAHALAFIEGLRDAKGRIGFDAHVGERGVKLSGGQRQRIAIARVLLKNAPILVLDEATSALDSEIEAAIQENLTELMAGKTVIAIAHRLSTIAAMDRLIVMDGGRIVEQGRHDDLLARRGLYANLWDRQSGGFLTVEADAEEVVRHDGAAGQ